VGAMAVVLGAMRLAKAMHRELKEGFDVTATVVLDQGSLGEKAEGFDELPLLRLGESYTLEMLRLNLSEVRHAARVLVRGSRVCIL
jgi:hypothetical protein